MKKLTPALAMAAAFTILLTGCSVSVTSQYADDIREEFNVTAEQMPDGEIFYTGNKFCDTYIESPQETMAQVSTVLGFRGDDIEAYVTYTEMTVEALCDSTDEEPEVSE